MLKSDLLNVLNDLIRTSDDRHRAFAEAADIVTKPNLKSLFLWRSLDCETAVIELRQLVESLGGKYRHGSNIAGVTTRMWIRLKTLVGDADTIMLREMENIEDKAKAAYAKALTATLPLHIRNAVLLQNYGAIRNHHLIRDLRSCQPVAQWHIGLGETTLGIGGKPLTRSARTSDVRRG